MVIGHLFLGILSLTINLVNLTINLIKQQIQYSINALDRLTLLNYKEKLTFQIHSIINVSEL
jgi:hypothetical protein